MIDQHINFIEQQIQPVAHDMEQMINDDQTMQRNADTLASTPGIGRLTARRLVAQLPELGTRNPKQIANLVGLAAINRDSGMMRGRRTTGGGRSAVRKLLYRTTSNASENPLPYGRS